VGCTVGDFDGDGVLDLFVASYGRSVLYRNRGGVFDEIAASVGIEGEHHAVGASWGDADNDGDLDLFVAGYESHGDDSSPLDQLYLNEGGRFRDVLPRESPQRSCGTSCRPGWRDGRSICSCWTRRVGRRAPARRCGCVLAKAS
jgi:hypothetical protein